MEPSSLVDLCIVKLNTAPIWLSQVRYNRAQVVKLVASLGLVFIDLVAYFSHKTWQH